MSLSICRSAKQKNEEEEEEEEEGGRQAGHAGNLMLKCIYSSQMISKSDKDPQRDWQGVAGRKREGRREAARRGNCS